MAETSAQELPSAGGDDITDDEFEALLDQLLAGGKHGVLLPTPVAAAPETMPAEETSGATGSDLITARI